VASTHLEVESKFDVDSSFALPDLLGLDGVSAVELPVEQTLEATYFDTADLRLLNARITLRRRTGGDDAGWHLKLPAAGSARLERHEPLGPATMTVPKPLAQLVRVRVRSAPLVPVAMLRTRRVVHRLLGAEGVVLAEVADDTVVATTLATAPGEATRTTTWREVEVELVSGREGVLAEAGKRLRSAGARPATSASKVGRALASKKSETPEQTAQATPEQAVEKAPQRQPKKKPVPPTAGDVARAHLASLVEELQAWDPYVRLDRDDAVHKMRVATRKLRSALATDRPLIARAATDPLREELKWLGSVLGGARDAEVLRARLRAEADALPPELDVGPETARIDRELAERYRTAHEAVLVELNGTRYLELVLALERLVASPPFTDRAGRAAAKEIPRVVRHTRRRVERAVSALAGDGDRDPLLHEVRKAAKRARYAAEASAGLVGRKAEVFARRMEDIQEILGRHQDGVVSRAELRGMGMRAHDAGETGFTYGLLYGIELAHAERDEQAFARAWASAKRQSWP